ncbi:MAG: undecaprenyl-diphosphate phosphatase [Actinomycetota bacterium]|nr:undecaprenyl-diphosphate phosphatase [Actinomycetota bacterium]
MSILEAIVLGAVQGLTEFVPISSSGHLVIVPELAGWDHPGLAFDVLLHAASLLALLVYFSGDLLDLARGFMGRSRGSRKLVGLLLIGTIPAALVGFIFSDYFEGTFEDAGAAALQLLITAVILVGAEQIFRTHERKAASTGTKLRTMDDMNYVDAGAIGAAQAISIFPGISRSGSTIGAGLGLAIERSHAARFAFLLAIPSLLGATIVEVPELGGSSLGVAPAVAGFVSSLVTSYAAIWGLIKYLRTNTLYPFAVYCVVAGIVFYALL